MQERKWLYYFKEPTKKELRQLKKNPQKRANIFYAARKNAKRWIKNLSWVISGMKNITNKSEAQFVKIFLSDEALQLQRSLTQAIHLAHSYSHSIEKHERKKGLDSIKAQVHNLPKKKKAGD